MNRPHLQRVLPPVILLGIVAQAHAVGFRLPNQDPEGIARGNAFAATADNPSAIYYNPAGITQLEGHHLSIGAYLISTNVDYRSVAGSTAGTDTTPQAVPQLYYVFSPADSAFSFGLGVYAPYGLGIDWGDDNPFATVAQEGTMIYGSANPVVAYQLSPTLSVAAGITLNFSDVELKRRIAIPGARFWFKGDGYDTGFNAGLLWQPVGEWSFGLNYRSSTRINYKGRSIAEPYDPAGYRRTTASLDFPMNIVGGVSYRPTDEWNFEFNLDWTDWDSVNDAAFRGTFGGDQVFPFRYESSFMYGFGATRQLGGGYFVSAGYIFSENSVPDRHFSPLNPDSDLHLGSIGFGRRGERFGWALGYHFAYNSGRRVSGSVSPSAIGETADGVYETLNHAVNLSCRYRF